MFWHRLFKSKTIYPTSRAVVSYQGLYTILRQRFPDEGQLYLSDRIYRLPSKEDIKAFLAQDKTNHEKYVAEDYDCDDFAYRLMGQFSVPIWSALAFGIVWTDLHALNCCVAENQKFYFIEPQNDKIMENLEPGMGSKIRFICM